MTTPRDTEAVLSNEEVRAILRVCSPEGVLVGGQALAFWADRYGIERPEPLVVAVSADVDFIGDSALATRLAKVLGWKAWIPSFDDATFQTGKVTRRLRDGSVKQADFLSGVIGLTTRDVVRRAVELEVPQLGLLRVMHPVDVLDSRIQNLQLLPSKRTDAGVAQGKLAVPVAAAFIRELIQSRGEKSALNLLERIADIAASSAGVSVYLRCGIDPLLAIPIDDFRTTTALQRRRWPQIKQHVDAQREKMRRLTTAQRSPRQ